MTKSKQPIEGVVYIATYERKKEPAENEHKKELTEKELAEKELAEKGIKIGITARQKKGKTTCDMVQKRIDRLNVIYGENAKNHTWEYYYRSKYYKSIEAYLIVCFFDERDGRAINEKEIKNKQTGKIAIKEINSQEHFKISLDDALKALKKVTKKIDDSQGEIISSTLQSTKKR